MEGKRLAPLVAPRTSKDIEESWGVDQNLWEMYERDPDLNGGALDFTTPKKGASQTSSQFSDLLDRVTKYSTMDVDADVDVDVDDNFSGYGYGYVYGRGAVYGQGSAYGRGSAYDRGSAYGRGSAYAEAAARFDEATRPDGSSLPGESEAVKDNAAVLPTPLDNVSKAISTPKTSTASRTQRRTSTASRFSTANAATNKARQSDQSGRSTKVKTMATTTRKKERSFLLPSAAEQKNRNRARSSRTSGDAKSLPRTPTMLKTTPTNTKTKDETNPIDGNDNQNDDDRDNDDDGNIEELRKTKKVRVREKKQIWGYDWLGHPVPCPFEANPDLPHQMYWENRSHFGDPIAMNFPSPHDLPEEDMDPGLMKVKNIVKELFDKKQKRFKDEAMAELNEIRGRILEIYNRYGIQWSFPDETEEERNKREERAKKKMAAKAKEQKSAKSDADGGGEEEGDEEVEKKDDSQPILVGGVPLNDASKLTGIPPEKLLLMSEGMQDLMIWLQKKALEEEDRLQLTKEIEDSNERAVQRTQVLLEANRWLQALGIDLTNPNIDCPYNDVAQNEMHARHHAHSGVNHNIFSRVSKLVAKTVVMGAYILKEYFEWSLVPPAPEITDDEAANKNRLLTSENQKTPSVMLKEEDNDKAVAMALTEEVKNLGPKGFFTDDDLIVNAENWKIAVASLEKEFKNAMELTYSKAGREKIEQCKRQAFCIKRTFEQQLSVITMRGAELGELQETLKTLQLELYDVKQYHRLREDVIKAKATECDLWNFRVKELEHTVATFLRTIQMFDMEYRAAVPKICKRIGEAMKYTSHITNAEEAKVKEKSEMTAFNAIATSVKDLDAKMTQTLKDFQEEQRQRQAVVRGRIEAANKKESTGFPPPPPPTTDYSVIEPKPPSPSSKKGGKKAGKGKGKKQQNKNFLEDEEDEEENDYWLGEAPGRLPTMEGLTPAIQVASLSPAVLLPPIGNEGGSSTNRGTRDSSPRRRNSLTVSPLNARAVSRKASSSIPQYDGSDAESVPKAPSLPPIDKKYLDFHK